MLGSVKTCCGMLGYFWFHSSVTIRRRRMRCRRCVMNTFLITYGINAIEADCDIGVGSFVASFLV